jgi:hypothetical protein
MKLFGGEKMKGAIAGVSISLFGIAWILTFKEESIAFIGLGISFIGLLVSLDSWKSDK